MLAILVVAPVATAAGEAASFRNDVMAVLSKSGCNQGACHGNANGKGGLKLSLRGDDPEADYVTLTRTNAGRLLNPTDPDRSLLLLKPSMQLAHSGGRRFEATSEQYHLLRRWIAGGALNDPPDAPRLRSIDVSPGGETTVPSTETVQLTATAHFTDGASRDVTSLAVYEPSQPTVEISPDGQVSPSRTDVLTEVAVAIRFLNLQQPVRLVFLPDRPDFVWTPPHEFASQVRSAPDHSPLATNHLPLTTSPIDRFVFAKLQRLQINPSPVCDDVTFVRRAFLDLTGVIPEEEEAREFVDSDDPEKRAKLIDRLLASPDFADWWAQKWSDLLRNEEKALDRKGVANFHQWIRSAIARGMPMNEFARELLSATGSTYASPAANYYRAMRDPVTRAESAAQVFLGVRLMCAKCHNHPFDRWTQDDYYGWASVFARVDYKVLENNPRDSLDKHEFVGEQIVYLSENGHVKDPRTGRPVAPQLLSGMMVHDDGFAAVLSGATPELRTSLESNQDALPDSATISKDPLQTLADWVAAPDNRQFARVQVNRLWAELFGRGIVEPVDDFRATNPPSHPDLLEWLTDDFIARGYDLRHTLRTVMNSLVYQLSSEPTNDNASDESNYSHAILRRLTAEQLLDSLSRAMQVPLQFNGYPTGLRAGQIPGVYAINPRYQRPAPADQFLTVFGKPERLQACSCERSNESTLAQTFNLISGEVITNCLSQQDNYLATLLSADLTESARIERLYWSILSRPPSVEERETFERALASSTDQRLTLEDMAWALLTSSEFLLRR